MLEAHISGKLEKEDYEFFVPEVERSIDENGKIRLFLELHDFRGWTAGALWEEVKFDAKHLRDLERLAVVGEKGWEKGMTRFCRPFTTAEVKFFEKDQRDEAWAWVQAE